MLRTLAIRDFVIVENLELEFSRGFTVLTGETGAGKSILIDALNLALGGRGDASMVREGASKADISADFATTPASQSWLDEHDLSTEENTQNKNLILRRVVDNQGRSKAYINGITATATQLRELGDLLVDIHGQHAHQSLLKSHAQIQLLDAQGQIEEVSKAVMQHYKAWKAVQKQRENLERDSKNILQERERLEWQLGELSKLNLIAHEWDDLSQEHQRLAHAASLLEGAEQALHYLNESEQSGNKQISQALLKLHKLQDYDKQLQPIIETLESARINLQESISQLNSYTSDIELDPKRLQEVEQRIEALHSASRKFHVEPNALLAEQKRLQEDFQQLADSSDMSELIAKENAAQAAYLKLAKTLSQSRQKIAQQLGEAVTQSMQELSMEGGRFEVALHECEPSAHGLENIEFLVAGHAGVAPKPLAKVASGGELARIALALSVITSSATSTPTLIFDEVDSGIGGKVAEVVGKLLKKLGQARQVLCVTHLPQVASQSNQHYQVHKTQIEGKTRSHISELHFEQRVEEIARMLGGIAITDTTLKHARELLS